MGRNFVSGGVSAAAIRKGRMGLCANYNTIKIIPQICNTFIRGLAIIFTVAFISIPFKIVASEQKNHTNNETETLQTEISQRDMQIIERLVAIAQRRSSEVQETEASMGLSMFEDVVSVELSPSQTTSNSTPDASLVNENSFSLTVTVDPIKLISRIGKFPVIQARLNEAKHQKRLAVIQFYIAYLQARQATKIAAYRMQKLAGTSRIASVNSPTGSTTGVYNLANPDYVSAATEMLNTNAREQIAIEELAACVGLPAEKVLEVIKK